LSEYNERLTAYSLWFVNVVSGGDLIKNSKFPGSIVGREFSGKPGQFSGDSREIFIYLGAFRIDFLRILPEMPKFQARPRSSAEVVGQPSGVFQRLLTRFSGFP
jgi:hypothetical protein